MQLSGIRDGQWHPGLGPFPTQDSTGRLVPVTFRLTGMLRAGPQVGVEAGKFLFVGRDVPGMGLEKAKSLLPVKGNDTFLDFIAKQIMHLREVLLPRGPGHCLRAIFGDK